MLDIFGSCGFSCDDMPPPNVFVRELRKSYREEPDDTFNRSLKRNTAFRNPASVAEMVKEYRINEHQSLLHPPEKYINL